MKRDPSDEEHLRPFRELLPATGAGIYLDTAYRGPLPAETHAAMREAEDWELRVGRAAEGRDDDFAQKRDEARAVVAALIGASPDDVYLAVRPASTELQPLVDPETGARRASVGTAVDATLAAGAIPLDIHTLGADLLWIPGDRWLLGPEATGAVWIRPGAGTVGLYAHDAEFGRTQVLGLARSVGWLEMYVGLPWIYERGALLARRLHAALSESSDIDVATPAEAMATVVMFRLEGWSVEEAVIELRGRVFAIVGTNESGDAIRASVAWFNTAEEIDRFAAAVAELARHSPATLPRRPTLLVH